MGMLEDLLARKTYEVLYYEKSSGVKDVVVLNADNLSDLKREFHIRFPTWKILKIYERD